MNGESCILTPQIHDEDSKLYKDLLNKNKIGRPLTNWVYSIYLLPSVPIAMDNAGYKRNALGLHNAKDVYTYLKVADMTKEITDIEGIELQENLVDNERNRIIFPSAEEALLKAQQFNKHYNSLVAAVNNIGNSYVINVYPKTSTTAKIIDTINSQLQAWEVIKNIFNAKGIDITALPKEAETLINASQIKLVELLKLLKTRASKKINLSDTVILLSMAKGSTLLDRILSIYPSIEEAANAFCDMRDGVLPLENYNYDKILNALKEGLKFKNIDLDALEQQVNLITLQVKDNNSEKPIRETLHELNKKYHIEISEIFRMSKDIHKLSEALQEVIINKSRELKELQSIEGSSLATRRLRDQINKMANDLAKEKYTLTLTEYLEETINATTQINALIESAKLRGTEFENLRERALILQTIQDFIAEHHNIVEALSLNITIDENIRSESVTLMLQKASLLYRYLENVKGTIDTLTLQLVLDTMELFVGKEGINGESMANVVAMAQKDSTMTDFMYSMSRASNPIIAAMGNIIRNAQDSRDTIINAFSLRIRRATDKLYKSGSNSEFMYEDDGHLLSDIDWKSYEDAKEKAKKGFENLGYADYDLQEKMAYWVSQNTTTRVVDNTNGRTEIIPNAHYRKAFPLLTAAQREYYDEMMLIKGEIGSLLPAYAQNLYLPPQIRRSTIDAITHSKNAKDVAKAIKNKIENLYKWREDDEDNINNTTIEGQHYGITKGNYDNTPQKHIPIFFVRPLEDADELLKNFSTGLSFLAGTAINYKCMQDVKDVVEVMGDFVKNKLSYVGKPKVETFLYRGVHIFKGLYNLAIGTKSTALINGWMDKAFYGINNYNKGAFGKFMKNIIAYTSFKGLSTNVKGGLANYTMGEAQMLIEAGAGEFYNIKDYLWAHKILVGTAGVSGDLLELLTNNMSHKSSLLREIFDPLEENFSEKGHTQYYKSMFRLLLSTDCSFLMYSSGEYIIHYVNMYSILHHTKVLYKGNKISLYDAFELTDKLDGNREAIIKAEVTTLDGKPIDLNFIDNIRRQIRYCNQNCHGAMNTEDKGLIHLYILGSAIMNFRQWMVEHYSRRYRARHWDSTLLEYREGFWVSFYKLIASEDTRDLRGVNDLKFLKEFMLDIVTFYSRALTLWHTLDKGLQSNVRRALGEVCIYLSLLGLSFALGSPDDHEGEFWYRLWMYNTKRLLLDFEGALPTPMLFSSLWTILQKPMASTDTIEQLIYPIWGLVNGDVFEEVKSGRHKGENRYIYNTTYKTLPFFKHIEELQNLDKDNRIFNVFGN